MTVTTGNNIFCSGTCVYCADTTFDGLYICTHPESDHQSHIFVDDHEACDEIVYGKNP